MNSPVYRTVHVAEALAWLARERLADCSVIASMPDYSEFPGYGVSDWLAWFRSAAEAILAATPDEGVTVFFQTDIKVDGNWIDKSYPCMAAAERLGVPLLWHKIACRVRPGQPTFGRPSYAHVLCFGKTVGQSRGGETPDVIPTLGDKVWERGMGFDICRLIIDFIATATPTRTVVNPFSGLGSVLAVANACGLNAVGIERSPKRAARSRLLRADLRRGAFVTAPEVSGGQSAGEPGAADVSNDGSS
jgi:hypothetical protein